MAEEGAAKHADALPEERVDPATTRLLVIDVQNDFCASGGWIDRHGADLHGIDRAVDKLEWLISRARAAGVKPIFVRAIYDAIYLSPPMLERHKRLGFDIAHCETGTWGAEFFRVRPEPDDIVITKQRYSAFVDTELGPLLRAQQVQNLIDAMPHHHVSTLPAVSSVLIIEAICAAAVPFP